MIDKEYILCNGEPYEAKHIPQFCQNDEFIYEVFRVQASTPLFLEDHFTRLQQSLHLTFGHATLNYNRIQEHVLRLIHLNKLDEGKIQLSLINKGKELEERIEQIPHRFPSSNMYSKGVEVITALLERHAPTAKKGNTDARQEADSLLTTSSAYEVLLINKAGHVTEGSRTNFFYKLKGNLYTPPVKEALPGVTRKHVLDIAHQLGLEVNERFLWQDEIEQVEALFLTGTSPRILPVNKLNDNKIKVEAGEIRRLMEAFEERVAQYIRKHKKAH